MAVKPRVGPKRGMARKKPLNKKAKPEQVTPIKVGSRPAHVGFQMGNRFWEARASDGRDKIFSTPEALWKACQEYFKWVEDNPMLEAKAFAYEGAVSIEAVPKLRVMTIGSLSMFLDISVSTWWDYAKHRDFSDVCTRAMNAIREQKFAGASSGFFNHAIIARDLGLVDKKEFAGPGGGPIKTITTDMTPKEAAEAWRASLLDDDGED